MIRLMMVIAAACLSAGAQVNGAEKLFSVRGQIVDWGTGRPVSGAVLELAVLTGTVVPVSAAPWMRESTGRAVDISDGKVDGDKFSFKVIAERKQGSKTREIS